ncbi:MAG: ABC transporter, partial [Burkholderiales bacterium]|nr:ABC transporter [Burkholderiales bacterium]
GTNRKEQRRAEAEERQRLTQLRKPLQNKIAKLEKELAELEQEKQRLDAVLADSATYTDANKTLLTDSLKRQGEVTGRLAEVESAWLDAQEAIEKIA